MDAHPAHLWASMDENDLRHYAATYVGSATDEMSDPANLKWTLEQFPTSSFQSVQTDWQQYYRDEVVRNPLYPVSFSLSPFHNPIVISIENDEIIIWDGWHRIACAVTRKDKHIMAVVGRPKAASARPAS